MARSTAYYGSAHILELKKSLARNETFVEYRFLKPFLAEVTWKIEKHDEGNEDEDEKKNDKFIDGMMSEVISSA